MNKGLYKGDGYVYWYKTWKNSSENSGASLSLEFHDDMFGNFEWENCHLPGKQPIGAACLAQW